MVDRLNMLMESRIHGDVYVRFGGEFSETCHRNTIRRWVLSLRLKSQYLFIFAGGLLAVFVVFVIMYMIGIDQWICIGFGVIAASVLVWMTFNLNQKYGEHGLMKLMAVKQHPRYLINRKTPHRLFKKKRKEVAYA